MVRTKTPPHHADVRTPKCVVYVSRNPVTFDIHRRRELYLWTRKRERQENNKTTNGMCMPRPRNVQLPLQTRTLLIADVTRLQPFTVGGDKFRENIETLISYNVRTDGIKQDCLYIEQGHLLTPTTFMTYSMAVDPRQSVVVTWTPIKRYFTSQESRLSSPPGSPFYTSC